MDGLNVSIIHDYIFRYYSHIYHNYGKHIQHLNFHFKNMNMIFLINFLLPHGILRYIQ
jgi:hypothetical protein